MSIRWLRVKGKQEKLMPAKEIWVFADRQGHELAPVTSEMLSEARKLGPKLDGKTCACLIGHRVTEYLPSLKTHGVEKVYMLENDMLSAYTLDVYGIVLQRLIENYQPSIIMFGATASGSELATRIAAKLRLPCITEAKRLGVEGQKLVIAKSCYEEKVYQNYEFHLDRTVVVTVLPGDMESEKVKISGAMEILKEEVDLEPDTIRTKSMKIIKGDPRKIRLEEGDLIVAGGKGIDRDIGILEGLADSLGASIGGTRPLVDDGVIPFERQIGITGKSVSPRLLVACGISGAREFVAGMEKAALIIAINKDARAPIFKFANLGILGDVHKILPLLTDRIRFLKQRGNRGKESNSPI